MTREEAIKIISEIKKSAQLLTSVPMNNTTDVEAFDMAISALSENKFDGMTNGEVIQALFPNCVTRNDNEGWFETNIDGFTTFTPKWWNAPYKKGK